MPRQQQIPLPARAIIKRSRQEGTAVARTKVAGIPCITVEHDGTRRDYHEQAVILKGRV